MVKVLEIKDCQKSEACHLLLKQKHEQFQYCPFCGERLKSSASKAYEKDQPKRTCEEQRAWERERGIMEGKVLSQTLKYDPTKIERDGFL